MSIQGWPHAAPCSLSPCRAWTCSVPCVEGDPSFVDSPTRDDSFPVRFYALNQVVRRTLFDSGRPLQNSFPPPMNRLGLLFLMMALLIIAVPQTAVGQTHASGSEDEYASQSGSLPSWAEPMDPSTPPGAAEGPVETHGPTLPPPGSRVPVDGGLIWLVAAGGAFAVYRLRSESSTTKSAA